jgi:antitoxin YefM
VTLVRPDPQILTIALDEFVDQLAGQAWRRPSTSMKRTAHHIVGVAVGLPRIEHGPSIDGTQRATRHKVLRRLTSNSSLAWVCIKAYHAGMRILPISKVKDRLNEFVDAVALTQDQITITKNGSPAAVLIGADEWESLQETLYWLSRPGIRESIAEADADIAAGRTYGEDEIRAEFGVPRRPG